MNAIYFEGEEYRHVPGFKGIYVSATGLVVSTKPMNGRGEGGKIHRLKIKPDKDGYLRTPVYYANRHRLKLAVHTAVLSAWHRPPKAGEEGRHLNRIRSDNNLNNLAWGTHQDNSNDMKAHGSVRGENNAASKMTEADVIFLRKERINKPTWQIVKENPQWSKFAVWASITGYTWAHLPGAVAQGRRCSKEGWKNGIKLRLP